VLLVAREVVVQIPRRLVATDDVDGVAEVHGHARWRRADDYVANIGLGPELARGVDEERFASHVQHPARERDVARVQDLRETRERHPRGRQRLL
jgi:hypothetical protein